MSSLPQSDGGAAHGRGDSLPHARRSAGSANRCDLQGMEAVVPLPDHLGHDSWLFRLHLSHVDLYRVAARLSRDRAAHERQVHWVRCGHSFRLWRGRRSDGRVSRGHSRPPRRLSGEEPKVSGHDRFVWDRGLHAGRGASSPAMRLHDRVHFGVALFCSRSPSTCAWALSSVAAPTNCTASIGAMQGFAWRLSRRGACAHSCRIDRAEHRLSFVPALVVGAVIGLASAASYLIFIVDRAVPPPILTRFRDKARLTLRGPRALPGSTLRRTCGSLRDLVRSAPVRLDFLGA